MFYRFLPFIALLFVLFAALPIEPRSSFAQEDNYDLLPDSEGPGKDYVYGICSGCHSIRLVVQQGLSYTRWDHLLDWMTEEQGMPELDEETRAIVLDYLSTYYNEDRKWQSLQE